MTLDINAIRNEFPILARKINNSRLAYLDSGASAQKPNMVIDGMSDFAKTSYANVHRGIHTLSNEATSAYENARKKVANFINADEGEIVFTKSATESLNLLANTLGSSLKSGDEILITELEHHANIVPWHMICAKTGTVLKLSLIHI